MATITPELERYVKACKDAGLPPDQVENFVRAGYVAFPEMLQFHAAARQADGYDGPDEILLGGTRGPGKSHAGFAQLALDDCQRKPGLKVLFLRKVMKTASESFEDLTQKILVHVPHTPTEGRVEFPNGSRILIGGYKDENEIDKYLGIEYDVMGIEEATQLFAIRVKKIRGSLRTSRTDWRERIYYTTNPDGVGIDWVKEKFIQPFREQREKVNRTRFIPCHWKNNPLLSDGYIRYLEGLDGALGKAWRDGDWDAFEGMALPGWREDLHVVDPFPIPDEWLKWVAIDYGATGAPYCALWFAKHPFFDRIYVYREAYHIGMTSTQQAKQIIDMTPRGEVIQFYYADPAVFSPSDRAIVFRSIADDYRDQGILLTKADNNRFNGKAKVDEFLGTAADGIPKIQVFRSCYNLVRTLPVLPRDKVNTWDVDTKAEDHAYDTLRYGLSNYKAYVAKEATTDKTQQRSPLAGMRML